MTNLSEPEWIFPYDAMEVGDSFFIPTLKPSELIYVADTRAKVAGIKIKAYPSSKEGHLGVRIWRIS